MDEDRPIRLTTNANIVRGLLAIVRRAAMSEFEAIQVETVFGDWFRQIEDQSKQFAALDRLAALARDQPPAEPPVGATGDVFDGDGDRSEACQTKPAARRLI